MRTLVLEEPGRFRLEDTPLPAAPGPGEVLVQVHRVGVCGTDLHAYRGRQPFFSYPRILGHELGVEILALGSGTEDSGLQVGDRCAVEPYLNCGECGACRRGKTNCCERLQVLGVHSDGGMREQIVVPSHKLHRSDSLSLDELALVEMLCIGAHAVRRAQVEAGEAVLVVGAGPIGLATMQFALLAGAQVAVLEVSPGRRAFCMEHLPGVMAVEVAGSSQEQAAAIRSALGGALPTLVFDATGNAQAMMAAFGYVANGGRLVLVGLVQADLSFYDPEFHRREMTLLSSRNATGEDFAAVIRALESGRVNLSPWITHRASPDAVAGEFPTWLEPERGVVKAMVEF
jgi:2-desacetyl-2-hydroxyethyl bacteriochlorophyllide A dehydrogenase